MTPRSYLFVPGDRPERFAKACAAGAHAVIVDLEDAVQPAMKDTARSAVAEWLSPAMPVLVRVNATQTQWHAEDAQLCRRAGVGGIILPKTETADEVAALVALVGASVPVLPLIETALGMANALSIARHRAVERLLFGSIDFQVDLRIGGDDEELAHFRSMLVLDSRLAGVDAPVDGVTTALDDEQQLRRDTLRARRFGFSGKLCIHPRQVAVVNQCFSPTGDEVAWAHRVVTAAAASAGGAVAVDGKMVDRPVILRAEDILREAEIGAMPFPPSGA